MNRVVITIDGPAASGKGSLSKKISEEFNFFYMETGIYYRGFASLFYKNQLNTLDLPYFISNLNVTELLLPDELLYPFEKIDLKLIKGDF